MEQARTRQAALLDERALGLASGLVALILYLACASLVALWPSGALALFNSLFHAVSLDAVFKPDVSAGRTLVGMVVAFAGSYALGWLFAIIYNRLAVRR